MVKRSAAIALATSSILSPVAGIGIVSLDLLVILQSLTRSQ